MCRQYPCDPRCPNAESPKPIYTCIRCDREICEGDAYYDIDIVKNASMPACTSQKVINTKFL